MEGYIIQNAEGKCLAKGLYWYEHDDLTEAYVHPKGSLSQIQRAAELWSIKPATVTPANWTPKDGVVITGDPQPFK